jgi:hypothetical protein
MYYMCTLEYYLKINRICVVLNCYAVQLYVIFHQREFNKKGVGVQN